jgi:hypothetical protein
MSVTPTQTVKQAMELITAELSSRIATQVFFLSDETLNKVDAIFKATDFSTVDLCFKLIDKVTKKYEATYAISTTIKSDFANHRINMMKFVWQGHF